jgi:hypothetical protein
MSGFGCGCPCGTVGLKKKRNVVGRDKVTAVGLLLNIDALKVTVCPGAPVWTGLLNDSSSGSAWAPC